MARVLIAAIVLAVAITLYGLFDCLLRDRGLIRVLPKPVWAIIILLVPVLGFVLWRAFGRGKEVRLENQPPRTGPLAPDDDEEYLRKVARDVELGKHYPEAGPDVAPDSTENPDSSVAEPDTGSDSDEAADSTALDDEESGSNGTGDTGRGRP